VGEEAGGGKGGKRKGKRKGREEEGDEGRRREGAPSPPQNI